MSEYSCPAGLLLLLRVLTERVVRAPGAKPARQKRRRGQGEGDGGGGEDEAAAAAGQQQQPLMQAQQGAGQQQLQGGPAAAPATAGAAGGGEGGEVLHPVQCAACETEVGLRDSEGVYHFVNVVASNA